MTLAGREWLFYKPFAVDVAFLRGTTADEDGNVTMEQEAVFGEMLSMAQATRAGGGVVIVQVRRLAKRGTLPAKQVKIPGMLVDLVVVDPDQRQTYPDGVQPGLRRRDASAGVRDRADAVRRAQGHRAPCRDGARPGAVCNLGSGISTGHRGVAAEEEHARPGRADQRAGTDRRRAGRRGRGGRGHQLHRDDRSALSVRLL